jgi:DNA-binding transcriptional MerR regulator
MKRYTSEEVCKLIGLPLSTLKYLHRKGFVCANPSQGKRKRNLYSDQDIELLKQYMKKDPEPKYMILKKSYS